MVPLEFFIEIILPAAL